MWHLGMWVSDSLGSIRLVVEVDGITFSNLKNFMFLTYERRKRPVDPVLALSLSTCDH